MKKFTKKDLLNERMAPSLEKKVLTFNDVYRDIKTYLNQKKSEDNKSTESEMDEGKLFTQFIKKMK